MSVSPTPGSRSPIVRRIGGVLVTLGLVTVSAGCGPADDVSPSGSAGIGTTTEHSRIRIRDTTGPRGHDRSTPVEVDRATGRLAVSHPGGVLVLDAISLEVVADLPVSGVVHLDPLGDDRHLAVSTGDGVSLLDMGTWGQMHGDHDHHYTAEPRLRGRWLPIDDAGHVVVHDGRTVVVDDSTGTIYHGRAEDLDRAVTADDPLRSLKSVRSGRPHRGIGVGLADGTMLGTLGGGGPRSGLVARDATGRETARSERCPEVHAQAAAAEAIGFGCTGAVVVYRHGEFRTVPAPDPDGRITTLSGHPDSALLWGDYSPSPADGSAPRRLVSIVDTERSTMRLLEVPAGYSTRSFGRDADGRALLLGTDGVLRVFDLSTATRAAELPLIGPWTVPADRREPCPALFVAGGIAYVTDPAGRALVAVDLHDGSEVGRVVLPVVPMEIDGVSGEVPGRH